MIRLTFVGDIALDKPLLKAAKEQGKGGFDFSDVFHTEDVFAKSDLVIGNLETVFGGGSRFNTKPYHYNSPDSFCDAIKNAGIGLVSTATNHCIDEGVEGIKRTLNVLDQRGIEHTGTFSEETNDRFLVKTINGIRIAFFSLTYSVNQTVESVECDDLYRYINLIGFNGRNRSWLKNRVKYLVRPKIKQIKKKLKKQSTIAVHVDQFDRKKINDTWMGDLEAQLKRAKQCSDLLVVLIHIGGQFNVEPGDYSKYMMDKLCELDADIIVGNHPHTAQRVEKRESGAIVAYSLGGYCMSVSGEYLVHDCLPEYSLALHVDIDEETHHIQPNVDILKGTEDVHQYLTVRAADKNDPSAGVIIKRSEIEVLK